MEQPPNSNEQAKEPDINLPAATEPIKTPAEQAQVMPESRVVEAYIIPQKPPYPISVEFVYPEKLSRLSTFFRVILVIPQSVVLYFVGLIAGILTFIAWFAIIFTGRYPKGLYNYVAGALRWGTRVAGYSYFLTDRYPPFSLK